MTNAPEGALAETAGQVVTESVPDKLTLTALARHWRILRLGCPRGCPLDHHELPCHLADGGDRR